MRDPGLTKVPTQTPKGFKKWNPLIIPWFPQCSNGFILGVPFLDPLGGLGRECQGYVYDVEGSVWGYMLGTPIFGKLLYVGCRE